MKTARGLRGSVIGLTMAVLLTACGGASTEEAETSAAPAATDEAAPAESEGGSGLPQLVGNTVSGSQFDTADFAGQDVVVWFWAPW